MSVEFSELMVRGGRELLDFLHYCVYTQQFSPLFVFLAREYRFRPTAAGAVALYDSFCAPKSQARLDAGPVLPPLNLRLEALVRPFRQRLRQPGAGESPSPVPAEGTPAVGRPRSARMPPPRYLFDEVVEYLWNIRETSIDVAAGEFDPSRSPMENLPGGRLSAGQRAFLEKVWRPRIRPQLVQAGFWRAANLGQ